MSRIWKLPVTLPAGVTAVIDGKKVAVKGPKGELSLNLQESINAQLEWNTLEITTTNPESSQNKAFWGLTRALIANMVVGVSDGYKKSLEILGVGYKFEVTSPTKLTLSVGFSHKVILDTPKGILVEADPKEKNVIHVSWIDKQQVGYFAALVRSIKKPEPYKGKGIRYVGEYVRRKAGKTAGKGSK
jgi:large subunit ribosomal protein L6